MSERSPRSLENLRLGPLARKGPPKTRLNLSLLPQTVDKLTRTGSASATVDKLVALAKYNPATGEIEIVCEAQVRALQLRIEQLEQELSMERAARLQSVTPQNSSQPSRSKKNPKRK